MDMTGSPGSCTNATSASSSGTTPSYPWTIPKPPSESPTALRLCLGRTFWTVINNPKGFKRPETIPGPDGHQVVWKPLAKSVRHFRRYLEIARSTNLRYLDALAAVKDTAAGYTKVHKLVQSQEH